MGAGQDPFLQMYHVRHRVLNPRLGIWMQPDPIGPAGGWNLHEYCGGDPLGFVDPTGLISFNPFDRDGWAAVGDLFSNRIGTVAKGAAKGAAVGFVAGAALVAAANAWNPAGWILGGGLLIYGAYTTVNLALAIEDGQLTEEQQAEVVGEFIGGTIGGLAGAKVAARPTRVQYGQPTIGFRARALSVWKSFVDFFIGGKQEPSVARVSSEASSPTATSSATGPSCPGSATRSGVTRTNSQLVQEIGARADAWGVRQGLTGTPREIGTAKHAYARRLLNRYQSLYGDRGLVTESSWLRGNPVEYGTKGSTRLDVLEPSTGTVWDFKFGFTPMSAAQRANILTNGPGVTSIFELHFP